MHHTFCGQWAVDYLMQEIGPVCAVCTQAVCLPRAPVVSDQVLKVAGKWQAHEQHSICVVKAQLITEQRVDGVIKYAIILAIILQDTCASPAGRQRKMSG